MPSSIPLGPSNKHFANKPASSALASPQPRPFVPALLGCPSSFHPRLSDSALCHSIPCLNHSSPDPLANPNATNHPPGCSTISNPSISDPAPSPVLLPTFRATNQSPPPPPLVSNSSPIPLIHPTSFPPNAPTIPIDQQLIPSQLTFSSNIQILLPRPLTKNTPSLRHKTTTPKASPPSLNDLPYNVISVIFQKSYTPTIDTSNPFSILDKCTFTDPTLNPSTFARNLQSISEGSSSIDLPPGFELPPKPSTLLPSEPGSHQEVDQPPAQPSSPSLDPKAQASQITNDSLLHYPPLVLAVVNHSSTSTNICKTGKGKKLTSPAPSTDSITRRSKGNKTSPKSSPC
ncbi:hypothetical protein MRB53_022666 [Persea americana]|uniref:Uncharacterized protein n=1 Tax=Persea americana TaxID=3435 RepID=A0ACC2L892_PERAE|nr:hypothetical protein MRB53_022666 [Persea americana]